MVCSSEPCIDLLEALRCGDGKRVCRALSLICTAIVADEEVVVHLGLAGIHIELYRLLMSKDDEVSEVNLPSQ